MPKPIKSRLDQIEVKILARQSLDRFDAFWMARRLRTYEHQLILATQAIENHIPGVGELDPLEVGTLVETYIKCLHDIVQLEQKRRTLDRVLPI